MNSPKPSTTEAIPLATSPPADSGAIGPNARILVDGKAGSEKSAGPAGPDGPDGPDGFNKSADLSGLADLAVDGIGRMYLPARRTVAQTLRGVRVGTEVTLRREGTNERYAAIVALGLGHLGEDRQRAALSGISAAELALAVADRAREHPDLGVLALAAWAAAEIAAQPTVALFDRLATQLSGDAPIPTVVCAWALTAALASDPPATSSRGRLDDVIRWSTRRLLAAQSEHGLFPHHLPPRMLGRWRAHVGCFADQVYPIQALARVAAASGNAAALAAANRCAARIVGLQGGAGQWWWHYDVRDGSLLEGYPVYSVHQHAMAPMALADLAEAGGTDHAAAISSGMAWLREHPEVAGDLIAPRFGVIWRKVGRREPRKAVRSMSAVISSYRPGLRAPWRDSLFPPVAVDRECRPYELGWLLYAWHRSRRGTRSETWSP